MIQDYHGTVRQDITSLLSDKFGRAIDVGGGSGATLSHLKATGTIEHAALVDKYAGKVGPDIDETEVFDLDETAALASLLRERPPHDLVLCLDVLEHLRDPWGTAAALREGISENGLLVVSLPNVRHRSVIADLLFRGRWEYRDAGLLDRTHLRFFTLQSMKAMLEDAGWRIESVRPLFWGKGDRLLDFVTFKMVTGLFARQFVLFARRAR